MCKTEFIVQIVVIGIRVKVAMSFNSFNAHKSITTYVGYTQS